MKEEDASCHLRSSACDSVLPVCGCDGKVYPSECQAHAAGIDIGGGPPGLEQCAHDLTPQGSFACGPYFCDAATTYCAYGQGDQSDRVTKCVPLPAACTGVPSCDCVPPPSKGECKPVPGNGATGVVVVEVAQ
ncbi:Hypothetical protein A7982_11531 [Minicystis rosea]|nr:Hypothetical protein A7982_11531 [Minicystis rosea]